MQTDATLLANNFQHCWMLHVASVCTPCCALLRKVWNRSNFSANNSQLFQQCWGHARSLHIVYKDLWVVSFPGTNIVGSCCIRLHTTANTHATTSNIVGATMLGVVAFARSLKCEKSSIPTGFFLFLPPIHCSVHKYGRRDVMWKQEIRKFSVDKTFIVPE